MTEDRKETQCWGLLRRRVCLVPTWRAWVALALLVISFGLLGLGELHSFLAVTDPLPGGLLVVEGWAPDPAFEVAVAEFKRSHYEKIVVTGGPIEAGAPLSEYQTYAQRGAAILLKMGLSTNAVVAVPSPWVRKDRTYASAEALKRWLREHPVTCTNVHLLTEDTHGRRSRLLFEEALGKPYRIGITSIPPSEYDARHWWRSSSGFRAVTGEALAYFYARFLFHPY